MSKSSLNKNGVSPSAAPSGAMKTAYLLRPSSDEAAAGFEGRAKAFGSQISKMHGNAYFQSSIPK